jgi:hypothetical protein
MPNDPSLDDSDRQLLADIVQHGWHGITVNDDEPAPFEYAVGFEQTLEHPAVIIFGLRSELMHSVLWGIFNDIKSGRRFEEEALYEDVLGGCAVAVRSVHESWHPRYLGYAMWHHRYAGRAGSLRAVQIVWPGKLDGLFPWERGCNEEVVRRQPRLDLPMLDEAR